MALSLGSVYVQVKQDWQELANEGSVVLSAYDAGDVYCHFLLSPVLTVLKLGL